MEVVFTRDNRGGSAQETWADGDGWSGQEEARSSSLNASWDADLACHRKVKSNPASVGFCRFLDSVIRFHQPPPPATGSSAPARSLHGLMILCSRRCGNCGIGGRASHDSPQGHTYFRGQIFQGLKTLCFAVFLAPSTFPWSHSPPTLFFKEKRASCLERSSARE